MKASTAKTGKGSGNGDLPPSQNPRARWTRMTQTSQFLEIARETDIDQSSLKTCGVMETTSRKMHGTDHITRYSICRMLSTFLGAENPTQPQLVRKRPVAQRALSPPPSPAAHEPMPTRTWYFLPVFTCRTDGRAGCRSRPRLS